MFDHYNLHYLIWYVWAESVHIKGSYWGRLNKSEKHQRIKGLRLIIKN